MILHIIKGISMLVKKNTGKVRFMTFHQLGLKLLRYRVKRIVVMLTARKVNTIEMLLAKNKWILTLMMQTRRQKTVKIRRPVWLMEINQRERQSIESKSKIRSQILFIFVLDDPCTCKSSLFILKRSETKPHTSFSWSCYLVP